MEEKVSKPLAASLGWRVRATRWPFSTPWLRLRQDDISLDDRGEEITYTYLDQGPAVYVVPVTADRQVILIRQFRYPVDAWCLEVPAGGSHDRPGVALVDLAREELAEEIGATAGAIEEVATFFTANAHSNQRCHVFIAWDVVLDGQPAHEVTEQIEIVPTPLDEAFQLVRTGQIEDGLSALALLLAEGRLQGTG